MISFLICYLIGGIVASVIVGIICAKAPTINDDEHS